MRSCPTASYLLQSLLHRCGTPIVELATIAAVISAACAVVQFLRDSDRRADDPNAIRAQIPDGLDVKPSAFVALALTLNTYDTAEIRSIRNRLAQCKDDFETTLDGDARCKCICHVLEQVAVGNGGALPDLDGWNDTFNQLCRI